MKPRSPTDDAASSDSEMSRARTGEVSLKLSALESLQGLRTSCDSSSYASSGASVERIKQILREPPCNCRCTMPLKPLLSACKAFWALGKEAQDALLWQIQSDAGPNAQWTIEGLGLKLFGSNS